MIKYTRYKVRDIEDPTFGLMCLECGVYVGNGKLHDAWHKRIEAMPDA